MVATPGLREAVDRNFPKPTPPLISGFSDSSPQTHVVQVTQPQSVLCTARDLVRFAGHTAPATQRAKENPGRSTMTGPAHPARMPRILRETHDKDMLWTTSMCSGGEITATAGKMS